MNGDKYEKVIKTELSRMAATSHRGLRSTEVQDSAPHLPFHPVHSTQHQPDSHSDFSQC